jgi:hypothetical protein
MLKGNRSYRQDVVVIGIILSKVFTRKLKLAVFSITLAVLTFLIMGQLSAAAPNPPRNGDFTQDFSAGVLCTFPIEISGTGKAKTIKLPGDRFIFTSPGLYITVTNLDDPSKQVTLNVTGAFHQTTEQDGSVVTVSTGRSLLDDPQAGFVLAIGNFSFVFDADGNLIQPLQGQGQLIDVCAMID